MSDLLSDPRARALQSADSGEVASLAGQFRRVASQAETAMTGLQGARNDATWTGHAADLFREKLGKLPGDLQKVAQSYGDAATALSTYANELGPLKSQFSALVPQITSAQTNLITAQSSLGTAQNALTTAQNAKGAKPSDPTVSTAQTTVSNASGAATRAQGTLDGLDGRALHILDEFDHVRGQARSAISTAAAIAPEDHSSWFSSAVSAVGSFVSGAAKFIAGAAVSVWKAAGRLPGDFTYLCHHLNDLKAWSKFAGDLGTVAGAVALVAAVIVCPLDAAGLEGAAALFSAVDTGAGAVALGATADKTIWDTSLALHHQGSWKEVAFDAGSLLMSGARIPGLKGAKGAATGLDNTAGALEQYAADRASGLTATQAYSALSDSQRTLLRNSTISVTQNRGLTTLISTTQAAAAHANKVKGLYDAGNEFVHAGADHSKDLLHDKLLPEPPGAGAGDGSAQPSAAGAATGG